MALDKVNKVMHVFYKGNFSYSANCIYPLLFTINYEPQHTSILGRKEKKKKKTVCEQH